MRGFAWSLSILGFTLNFISPTYAQDLANLEDFVIEQAGGFWSPESDFGREGGLTKRSVTRLHRHG